MKATIKKRAPETPERMHPPKKPRRGGGLLSVAIFVIAALIVGVLFTSSSTRAVTTNRPRPLKNKRSKRFSTASTEMIGGVSASSSGIITRSPAPSSTTTPTSGRLSRESAKSR